MGRTAVSMCNKMLTNMTVFFFERVSIITITVPGIIIARPIKYAHVGYSLKITKDIKVPINGDIA